MKDSELIADYVIVGGGSAGCVLANRLSEDRDVRVILLEAGGDGKSLAVSIPAGTVTLMNNPKADWCYEVEPDPSIGDRRLQWAAGKMLGGSSAINGMVYIRGIRDDYDNWARMGCSDWSYDDVLPYFLRAERWYGTPSPNHGTDGPLAVSPAREIHPLTRHFVAACIEAGLPQLDDYCGGDQSGVFFAVGTQHNGMRCSTAKAYLQPIENRPNLTVVTGAQARRILFDTTKRAHAVEFVKGGSTVVASARREVILAAGTIASPLLLLRSGVGPAPQLRDFDIPVVADRAEVGKNLQEHPSVRIAKLVNLSSYNTLGIGGGLAHLWRYATRRRGALASIAVQAMAFIKTDPMLDAPDVQLNCLPVCMEFPSDGDAATPPVMSKQSGMMITPNICRPHSRGEIRLRSADLAAPPIIDHRLLGDVRDVETLIRAARFADALFATAAMKAVVTGLHSPPRVPQSEAAWTEYVRHNANISFHPVGSCRMGGDAAAVVDTRLRVRGVSGLRVIDASVMPTSPSANTNAPTIMIAERAAEMIRSNASTIDA